MGTGFFSKNNPITAAALAVALLLPAGVMAGSGWEGKIETRKGVKTVVNPARGFMEPSIIELEELWRLGGDTDDEDEFFGVISDIRIDEDGNVFLLDSQLAEVKIYTSDGVFIRSIGREGEGPGEFRKPSAMLFTPDGNVAVVQMMPAKIVLLTKEGDPLGEQPLPKPEGGGFQLVQGAKSGGGNTVLFMARQQMDEGKWSRTSFLASVSGEGDQLAEYSTKTNVILFANATMSDAAWDTFDRRWAVGPDGKVYACEKYDDYAVTVYNKDGSVDKVITRDYVHRARTGDEKDFMNKMFSHWAKMIPNCKVEIHDMCKDIDNIFVREDGSFWVLNSNGSRDNEEGTLGVFDVFNKDGQFVRIVTLKGHGDPLSDLYVFEKDRFYVVTSFLQAAMNAQGVQGLYDEDDETEPMAVICYKLDGDVLAAR